MPYQNMSLAELARHIGMDAREVERLAARGNLPGKHVGGQWRFNRAEMLEWLQREMHTLDPTDLRNLDRAMGDGQTSAMLGAIMAPEGVEMNLGARSRASVPRELVKLAERTGLVYDPKLLVDKLLEREQLCSTGLPGGIAFPHPRQPQPYAAAEPLACLARVQAGVPYGAPDGGLTYLFVLVCCHDDRSHLQVLARLSMVFRDGLARQLVEIDDNAEALELVLKAERELPR
jgi:PTS system nitrogen regulatory IIA component